MSTAVRVAVDDKHHAHVQNTPASAWVIVHGLGKHPAVSVVDSAGTVVNGSVRYDSLDQVTVTFSSAFSGQAFCN